MEGDKEKCLAAGMQDYLTKPIRKNQMLKLIARWLPDHILGDVGKECYNKVLLVEDNSINRAMAKEMLKGLGFVVTSAINGKIGVEKAQENEFDLILMDCQMPEMDGFEATKAIRELQEQEKIKPTPIIALTANAMKGDRELCIKAGMDDYITKPVKKDTLQTSIAKWITPSTIVSNTDASKIDVIDYNIFNTYKEVVAEKFTSFLRGASIDEPMLIFLAISIVGAALSFALIEPALDVSCDILFTQRHCSDIY